MTDFAKFGNYINSFQTTGIILKSELLFPNSRTLSCQQIAFSEKQKKEIKKWEVIIQHDKHFFKIQFDYIVKIEWDSRIAELI